jgi:autotransporter-associated beta strand protein
MRKRSRIRNLSFCLGGFAVAGLTQHAFSQITVNGSYKSAYGSALATQTINSGFGYSTVGDGTSGGGSELDAGYATIQNGTLYVFLAGNVENNGNHFNLFIDDGRSGGQNTLNETTGSGPLHAMNGSIFSSGFNATYVLDGNDYANTFYLDQYDLVQKTGNYLGSVPLTNGVGSNNLGGILAGINNKNISPMTGASGAATNAAAEDAVTTGMEFGIPLSVLGNPAAGSTIKLMADLNGGNDAYLSNQFLPGLPVGTQNLADGTEAYSLSTATPGGFNFSTLPNEYFTVTVPSLANGTWVAPGSGSWGTGTNWANGYIPHVAGDSTSFATATANSTVTLGSTYTAGSVSFDSSYSYTIAASAGGKLTLDNGASSATVTDYGGNHTISAPLVLNSNTTLAVPTHNSTMTVSGNISGTGGLTISTQGGSSPLILSGANTYSGGTTVAAGNLQLGSSTALPNGTALTLSALDVPAGVLDLNGNSATVSSITVLTGPQTQPTGAVAQIINTTTAAVTSTLTYAGVIANPSTFNGNIVDSSGASGGTTALTVASGMLTLNGSNTYGGPTTINAGATLDVSFVVPTYVPTISLPTGNNVTNNGSLVIDSTVVTTGSLAGSGTTTVNADGAIVANTFNQTGGLVNNGTVTIQNGGTTGPISGAGTMTIGGTLKLNSNIPSSTIGSLTINTGASLDINNDRVYINYGAAGTGDPIATIVSELQSGYAGGTWTGTGIVSSAAASTAGSFGIGYADSADPGNPAGLATGVIELVYTLLGDANLDGKVNGADFAILATNFNKAVTGSSGWDQGDFNYDGKINGADFAALAKNFNKGYSAPADVAALSAFAEANGLSLSTSVPEPATLALGVIAGLGMLKRRRRQ